MSVTRLRAKGSRRRLKICITWFCSHTKLLFIGEFVKGQGKSSLKGERFDQGRISEFDYTRSDRFNVSFLIWNKILTTTSRTRNLFQFQQHWNLISRITEQATIPFGDYSKQQSAVDKGGQSGLVVPLLFPSRGQVASFTLFFYGLHLKH